MQACRQGLKAVSESDFKRRNVRAWFEGCQYSLAL